MTNATPSSVSERVTLHGIACLVALCSFAYELVYSELLTVIYGGTVTQYGLTIGLFFSSLGIGSFFVRHFADAQHSNFFRTEVYLALTAPVGFLFILWVNTAAVPQIFPNGIIQVAARLPVVAVGVLSGFELPLLLSMVQSETGRSASLPNWITRLGQIVENGTYRVLSAAFQTDRESTEYDTYSTVLAMDYLGGLLGALVYVFVLYPRLGLIPSVFVLALLNCLAAVLFVAQFSGRWRRSGTDNPSISFREQRAVLMACLLLTAVYGGIAVQHHTVDDELTGYYMESLIEDDHPEDTVSASITDQYTTRHQQVVRYERSWNGESENQLFAGESDTCLRQDSAIQLCDSWADSYHHGLVDVPMTMYENSTETEVLLVGGGDWIAANYLRDHNVSVDQVDIDREFMNRAKHSKFLEQYHDNAYEYDNLTVYDQDIYTYLQNNDRKYDIILLDLPGAKNDDLLPLYSVEFYSMLADRLTDHGTVVTWGYSGYTYGPHHKAYTNTVREAGFDHRMEYYAYNDPDADGTDQLGERFFIFAPRDPRSTITPANGTDYVRTHGERYRAADWSETPRYVGVEPNSVFDPNYDLIVNTRVKQEDQ
jgi:spermidine synthase